MTKAQFEEAETRAKDHIVAGNIFQVVLSQRFEVGLSAHPFVIFRALRVVNPSPYLFYLKIGDR
jgi:anthranilate synthase component 1